MRRAGAERVGGPHVTRSFRRYAVLGSGAIGGFYGARLVRAGHEVHFVLRSDYAHVAREGLRIESVDGDFRLPEVNAHATPATVPRCDVAIVALKTTSNGDLEKLLAPLLHPGLVVLVLQNGLEVERDVAAVAPDATVIGGMCFICSNKLGPGHVRHVDYGRITIAQYAPGRGGAQALGTTEPMAQIARDFSPAGIEVQCEPDLAVARWRKLVWNVPYNGLTALLGCGTDALMRHPEMRRLVRELMSEVVQAAAACGSAVDPRFIDEMLATTDAMSPYETSMKRDFDAGRSLELDAIYGQMIRASRAAGFLPTRTEMLHRALLFLEERRARESAG